MLKKPRLKYVGRDILRSNLKVLKFNFYVLSWCKPLIFNPSAEESYKETTQATNLVLWRLFLQVKVFLKFIRSSCLSSKLIFLKKICFTSDSFNSIQSYSRLPQGSLRIWQFYKPKNKLIIYSGSRWRSPRSYTRPPTATSLRRAPAMGATTMHPDTSSCKVSFKLIQFYNYNKTVIKLKLYKTISYL